MVTAAFLFFFFLMIRRPPRSTLDRSSAASDVYKRQVLGFAQAGVGGHGVAVVRGLAEGNDGRPIFSDGGLMNVGHGRDHAGNPDAAADAAVREDDEFSRCGCRRDHRRNLGSTIQRNR